MLDSRLLGNITVSSFTTEDIVMLSEPDMKYELSRIEGILAEIAIERMRIQEQDRKLEVRQTTFTEVEKTFREALAKFSSQVPSLASPVAMDQVQDRKGMRPGSRTQRVCEAVVAFLEERGGPTYKEIIADHVVQLGLVPSEHRNVIFNLLSGYKALGLIDTDHRGSWRLPHQSAIGAARSMRDP
jgi:hypothetical protein